MPSQPLVICIKLTAEQTGMHQIHCCHIRNAMQQSLGKHSQAVRSVNGYFHEENKLHNLHDIN